MEPRRRKRWGSRLGNLRQVTFTKLVLSCHEIVFLSSPAGEDGWRFERCRTAALGGHLEQCDQCGHERNAYNSCADRHWGR